LYWVLRLAASQGVGRAVNPTTPAILNAIYDAAGARLHDLPATPEAVLRAMPGRNGDI
jgi:CO/xanthine dehydrogenase Mo-binding subunit